MTRTTSPEPPSDFNLPESYHALAMLIDDQPFVADAIRCALRGQADIDFHYCADPRAAIAAARKIKPTVILLDLVMPEISGLTLLAEFRGDPTTADIPIVILSAEEDARKKSEAFANGADDYLVKLPETVELRARVRYHSRAHWNRLQRDEAFRALRESQQQLVKKNTELSVTNEKLSDAVMELKQLRGLLPICSCCKRVRDDGNYWHQIDAYLSKHSDLVFSHGLCPECCRKMEETLGELPDDETNP